MKFATNPLLKPLFTAIARLPLIGPHGQDEAALLRSGSKPVGMFAPQHPDVAALQHDVDAGRLIRVDVPRTLPRAMTIYAVPGTDMSDAAQAATHIMKAQFEGPDTYPSGRDAFNALSRGGSVVQLKDPASTAATEFLDGQHTVLLVPSYAYSRLRESSLREEFGNRVADGRITAQTVECTVDSPMVIFGQPGKESDMATLAVILRDGYAGKSLPPHIDNRAEGRILGYSDRDIDLWTEGPPQNTVMNWLLKNTQDMRRDIRLTLMKEAGPNWPRNP